MEYVGLCDVKVDAHWLILIDALKVAQANSHGFASTVSWLNSSLINVQIIVIFPCRRPHHS